MADPSPEHFDAVVIGTGFGGSVTAYRLAKAGWKVCVLERGRPWAPGAFGRTPYGVRDLLWDPDRGHFGMFDVWSFSGVNALVGSGLGGGSLIYANVMLEKDPATFDEDGFPFPYEELAPHYDAVAAIQRPERYPLAEPPYDRTGKAHAMVHAAAAAGHRVQHPPLAVRFRDDHGVNRPGRDIDHPRDNLHGVQRETCRLCGECDLGCNYGAKSTLDLTYLSLAHTAGADLRCLCDAQGIDRLGEGRWRVRYRQRLDGRDGHPPHLLDPVERPDREVTAAHVVVACGTVGTARLLLRSRTTAGLDPSLPLGQDFSTNGDVLTMAYGVDRSVDMSHGPVITTSIDVAAHRAFHVQDAGAPAFAMWMLHALGLPGTMATAAGAAAKVAWANLRGRRDPAITDELAKVLGASRSSDRTLALLSMGRDRAGGAFTLDPEDGKTLELSWTEDESRAFFDEMERVIADLVEAMGGEAGRAPWSHLVTVHALGGARMGAPGAGVVDAHGRVHSAPGLHVADGAVLPGPVGPNPSFTIAALADRFATTMIEEGV